MDKTKIVDCHGHIFPPLAEAGGFKDAELHLLFQQRSMHGHSLQPVRRRRDHQVVTQKHLWKPDDPSETGRATEINFRVGRFGRYEWEKDGESYYVQFLPPHLQDMHAPSDFIVTQMDHVGIDVMVLQNDHTYGNLAEYFAEAMGAHPDRFIALAQVEEAFAYRDDQISILEDSLNSMGMSGLYFTVGGFFRNGYREYYTDPVFQPFWDVVRRAQIPVFWVFFGSSPKGSFVDEMLLFQEWLERYPDIPSVLVHGIPTALFDDGDGRVVFPDPLADVMDSFPVYSEVLFPIGWGGRTDFPFVEARGHFRQVYDRFGPDRLMWGSDMPNVERYCTYRQSLSYVLDYCDFLSSEDKEKIFRSNTLGLFETSRQRQTVQPASP